MIDTIKTAWTYTTSQNNKIHKMIDTTKTDRTILAVRIITYII